MGYRAKPSRLAALLLGVLLSTPSPRAYSADAVYDTVLGRASTSGVLFETAGEDACSGKLIPDGPDGPPTDFRALKQSMAQLGVSDTEAAKKVEIWEKRNAMIHYAVGAAQLFQSDHDKDHPLSENQKIFIKMIQESANANVEDWCALLPVLLIKMVESTYSAEHRETLQSTQFTAPADEYESAYKMLDTFSGAIKEKDRQNLYCGGKPAGCQQPQRHPELFIPSGKPPVPGCLAVFFDKTSTDSHFRGSGHVAFVAGYQDGKILTVEGNTELKDSVDVELKSPFFQKGAEIFAQIANFNRLSEMDIDRVVKGKMSLRAFILETPANVLKNIRLSINHSGDPSQDTNQLAMKVRDLNKPLEFTDAAGTVHKKVYQGCIMPWPGMDQMPRDTCSDRLEAKLSAVSDGKRKSIFETLESEIADDLAKGAKSARPAN